MDFSLERALRERVAKERGEPSSPRHAPLRVALAYPSPYRVAMSSLGFLQLHRILSDRPGTRVERVTLPDPGERELHLLTRTPLMTLESRSSAADFDVLAISHAYELESAGIATLFELMGVPPRPKDRGPSDPLVVLGGPITFSNPLPSAGFADVVVLGEAEGAIEPLMSRLEADPTAARGSARARARLLEDLASIEGFYIPRLHGERLLPIGKAPDAHLPARAAIWTPDTELSDMFLIEPERGCHRGCTFCVMRRSTNGGMRTVPPERLFELVPETAERVGLVGAAVTDHPRVRDILKGLVDERGKRIGVSSLRADRLDDELVGLLARGGYRSMTVALDAASARLRHEIEKILKERHVEAAAHLAKQHGMKHLKIYVVIALPGETRADLEELTDLTVRLSKTIPVVLGVSPLVPKLHTPLATAAFAGEATVEKTVRALMRSLRGRADVRAPSPREAYVEYRLAQGGLGHVEAAIAAAKNGSTLSAWKRALADLPERVLLEGSMVPAVRRALPLAG
ncbi:MAG: radical SAM protein [Deltaproteobacteria bacterium]|nr:radical SAM protein [Deltaproteobacteria bacterium]